MHQIRLYQSTWADAQWLMVRWGAWRHYDGSCTAERIRQSHSTGCGAQEDNPETRRELEKGFAQNDTLNP